MFYMTDDIRDRFYDFYKDDESDQIWSVSEIGEYGRWLFTFDCKKIYNFYEDYIKFFGFFYLYDLYC